jgi:hypothetical protein
VRCLRTLSTSAAPCAHVLTLELDLSGLAPTRALLLLVHRVLLRLPRLRSLALELPLARGPRTPSHAWLLAGAPCALRVLSTSLAPDAGLAAFLAQQPALESLSLRGPAPAPAYAVRDTDSEGDDGDGGGGGAPAFALPPSALPRLRVLRSAHAGPALVRALVAGRPVSTASVSVGGGGACALLDALGAASVPLRRVTLMAVERADPCALLGALARVAPGLHALHLVALFLEGSPVRRFACVCVCVRGADEACQGCSVAETLARMAGPLAAFRELQYITLLGGRVEAAGEDAVDEGAVAARWADACPTLRTIVLPQGKIWFKKAERRWKLLEDAEEDKGGQPEQCA